MLLFLLQNIIQNIILYLVIMFWFSYERLFFPMSLTIFENYTQVLCKMFLLRDLSNIFLVIKLEFWQENFKGKVFLFFYYQGNQYDGLLWMLAFIAVWVNDCCSTEKLALWPPFDSVLFGRNHDIQAILRVERTFLRTQYFHKLTKIILKEKLSIFSMHLCNYLCN